MKRILNILMIFTMVLTMSIPAYAWGDSGSNLVQDNLIPLERLEQYPIPDVSEFEDTGYLILYSDSRKGYFLFENTEIGDMYNFNTSTGRMVPMNGIAHVYYYDDSNDEWVKNSSTTSFQLATKYYFATCSDDTRLFENGKEFEIIDGVVTYLDGSDSSDIPDDEPTDEPTSVDLTTLYEKLDIMNDNISLIAIVIILYIAFEYLGRWLHIRKEGDL